MNDRHSTVDEVNSTPGVQPETPSRAALWMSFWGCGVLALVLDQATKWIALATLDPYAPPSVIPGLFELRLVHNDGAAFSMFQGGRWLFIAVSIGAALFLPFYLRSLLNEGENHSFYPLGLGLIWGGAMGNAVDRVFREQGLVVDFFHVFWKDHSFPVFNVADSAITAGLVAIVVAAILFGAPDHPQSEKENAPDTL
ncbi:MAG: signal peptidase II [Candidatus Omnitrophica bacterium]|nr:signal peptidase II [Candidatus Omnitrophota bacterium]MCB9781457.1 signal peptidase II [Candidatus Omnitrophota bacterium]